MSYLDRLKGKIAEIDPEGAPPKPPKPGSGGFGGYSQGHIPELRSDALSVWRDALNALDPINPLHGFDKMRWRQLVEDARWVLDKFGKQAARDGWSTADLFGLWPGVPHAGGIADRLRGSRSLVLTANRAHWRSWGQVDRFNRGSYLDLLPFWQRAS